MGILGNMMKLITKALIPAVTLLFAGCGVEGDKDLSQGVVAATNKNPNGTVLAVGIPQISAIRQVGPFLDSSHDSPFALNPLFIAYKGEGRVLDKNRVMVASSSNFGAPLYNNGHLPGSLLTLATDVKSPTVIDPNFASNISETNLQPSGNKGDVQMYASNNYNFINVHNRPEANTYAYSSTSFPTGISINNAFGRPWISNAPQGTTGGGTSTVVDPDGKPLEALLTPVSGGVFAGGLSERAPQLIPGSLDKGSVGTGFMGTSPGNDIRAVFALANSDGSIAQVHVSDGIDGLAPAGTITPLKAHLDAAINDNNTSSIIHVGILFNWVGAEGKVLYVTDPLADRIAVLPLASDDIVFRIGSAGISYLTSTNFKTPIDMAPVIPEFANGDFSGGTTLAASSDMYVANNGDNTIVRIKQDGTFVDKISVSVDGIGVLDENSPQKVYGIATSWDAKRIYVAVRGTHPSYPNAGDGFVVELDAFGF